MSWNVVLAVSGFVVLIGLVMVAFTDAWKTILAFGKATAAVTSIPAGNLEWFWTILLVLAGAAVFYWGLYTPGLRLSQVGEWSWNHWLSLPSFCLILFALTRLNEKPLGVLAGTLRAGMALALFLLFLGIPAGLWIRDASLSEAVCKDGNMSHFSTCRANTAWSTMFRATEGRAADGMNLCYSPSSMVEYDYVVKDGTSFYRFRSKEGEVEVKYIFKKLPPGGTCPEM